MKQIKRTANDKEPNCLRCENLECNCRKQCGPQHWWNGYYRYVTQEQLDMEESNYE